MSQAATREVGRASALLTCNRFTDHPVWVQRDLPGAVILVHGVNDVGVSYQAFEKGLCQGLNERLNRADLTPNTYRIPQRGEKVVADPDKVYYRLQQGCESYSPVIPFYWGYRAHEREVAKELVNGQVVDRRGNRLDRDFAKGGGMFANATSNIPDMFNGRFNSGLLVWGANKFSGDAHPLRAAPERRYMVLAAKRLAALIAAMRAVAPDDTVSVVAHSQGCLISLLAQAFLAEEGKRVADCLVLNNPPYGLHEPFFERFRQNGSEQQTTAARVATFVNLVKLVTDAPHPSPPLSELIPSNAKGRGRAGLAWSPTGGRRPAASGGFDKLVHVFAERDNRGKVYLYFTPHDMTVGLQNVQGIGTFGVPEQLKGRIDPFPSLSKPATGTNSSPWAGSRALQSQMVEEQRQRTEAIAREGFAKWHAPETALNSVPVRPLLGSRFLQRVWTWRQRDGKPVAVGAPGYTEHTLRLKDEPGYDAGLSAQLKGKVAEVGEVRCINAEPLSPPCPPDLHHGELGHAPGRDPRYEGKIAFDPIDAAVAVTKGPLRERIDLREDLRGVTPLPTAQQIEAEMNAGKDEDGRTRVLLVERLIDGSVAVHRIESPAEARQRYQDDARGMPNSYHSAIVANPEHHRWVTAMDVAIGQARAMDDPEWRDVFIAMADWRSPFDQQQKDDLKNYARLSAATRQLIEATWLYYNDGKFPTHLVPADAPPQVVRQSRADRAAGRMSSGSDSSRSRS